MTRRMLALALCGLGACGASDAGAPATPGDGRASLGPHRVEVSWYPSGELWVVDGRAGSAPLPEGLLVADIATEEGPRTVAFARREAGDCPEPSASSCYFAHVRSGTPRVGLAHLHYQTPDGGVFQTKLALGVGSEAEGEGGA